MAPHSTATMIAGALLLLIAAPAEPPVVVTGHRWAPFISPMGEPFRARTTADDTLALWFAGADRDRDGTVTRAEFEADAARFFAALDVNADGRIEPDELVRYEWQVAPDIQVNNRQMRPPGVAAPPAPKDGSRPRRDRDSVFQGAARYALLNIPEPVAAADRNFDRSITAAEFRLTADERFGLLDRAGGGLLTFAALDQIRTQMIAEARKKRHRRTDDADDPRVGTPL